MADNAVNRKKLGFPMTTLIAPVTPLSTLSICYPALFGADDSCYQDALIEAEKLLSHVEVFAKLTRAVSIIYNLHNFHCTNSMKNSIICFSLQIN